MSGRGIAGPLWVAAVVMLAAGCAGPGALAPLPPLGKVTSPATGHFDPAKISPEWEPFGAYLQRLIDAVQIQWERVLIEARTYPTAGTHSEVVFRLGADGAVKEIIRVTGDAGKQGDKACVAAIALRPNYGAWTEAMKSRLGESQEMTFVFYYQ